MRIHLHDSVLGKGTKGAKTVLAHVERCAKCKAELARLLPVSRFGSSAEEDYEAAFEHSYRALECRQAALERERGEAFGLLTRLLDLISERQQLLLRNSRRFQNWGLLELVIQCGEQETFIDPSHAEEIFRLALDVSTNLDSSFYGKERIEDMRARTWGYIGNARRVRMDLPASEEAFKEAFERLQTGTEDVMERATLFDMQTSLRRAQRRCDEALRLSTRAIAVFEKAGETHRAGKALLTLSTVHQCMGNIKEALSALYRSFELFDSIREPRLELCALHNLGDCLSIDGRFMEAQRVLARARPLYLRFCEPRSQSRRKWLEARIAWGLGRKRDAEELFMEARDGFLSINANFESDLVVRESASSGVRAAGIP